MRKSRWPLGCWLLLILALMGCALLPGSPTSTPPAPQVMADCFINFYLSAYEDSDRDGARDEGERGLPGVEFTLNGSFAYSFAEGRAVTDEQGQASIDTWSPGECQEFATQFSIEAAAPAGYTPSAEFPFDVESDGSTQNYEFGFYPVDPAP